MDTRTALTIRFPSELLVGMRESRATDESLNGFVLAAVDREVRRRQAMQSHQRIVAIREEVETATGRQPGAARVVRELREGSARGE
jgi:hypothetical protein